MFIRLRQFFGRVLNLVLNRDLNPDLNHDLKSRFGDIAPTAAKYEGLKRFYIRSRDSCNGDSKLGQELKAWKSTEDNFRYELIKGLLPRDLVGQKTKSGHTRLTTDTFFSEYKEHNDTEKILSETDHSYIIGNAASYDSRQYPDKPDSAGQGFGHCLVIPRQRIYNIVDPAATADDCFIIREMHRHFLDFWSKQVNRRKMLVCAKQSILDQYTKMWEGPGRLGTEVAIKKKVLSCYRAVKKKYLKLRPEDFIFGFHPHPTHSVGHLHMHVFPHAEKFREYSTKSHDCKTIPLQAILEAELGK
ncbi:MAG: hypothetical protein LQ346_005215 [Caloplaca aetnensis]|nr:MAG: hypothetical protein LQ346_005215 [Caloplaca aetnensis]